MRTRVEEEREKERKREILLQLGYLQQPVPSRVAGAPCWSPQRWQRRLLMKAELVHGWSAGQLTSVDVPGRRRSRSCDAAGCISARWRRGRRGRSGPAAQRSAPPPPDAATGPHLQTHFLDYSSAHSRGILGKSDLGPGGRRKHKSTSVLPASCCEDLC